MEIKESEKNGIRVVALDGRLDSLSAPEVETCLLAPTADHPRLAIDFSRLNYISSAGLRVLLMAAKKAKQSGGRLVLCNLAPHIREVFEISGFLGIFDIQASLDEALSGLAQ